jgi:hypothetical protein
MAALEPLFISNNLNHFILLAVKIIYLIVLGLYVLFAVIVKRQIQLMITTLDGTLNLPLKTLGWTFLLLSIFVFFLGLLIL